MNKDVSLLVYSILPDKYTDIINREAEYARIAGYKDITSYTVLAFLALDLGTFAFLDLPLLYRVGGFILVSPFSLLLPYVFFTVMAERRRKTIEQVLPDALLLMSANIESGLTVDRAFLMSARDEFGPLADDIRLTAMKMFGGMPVEDALDELAESTNSELFEETLKLLVDGINSGGEVSQLLESSAEDIRNSLQLREEIYANVKMYSIFILIASMLGAPLLFGVSTYLTETTAQLWSGASGLSDIPSRGPIQFQAPNLNVDFFRTFALAALAISNAFAALIISEIKDGNMKSGFKYVPVFVTVSVAVYLAVTSLISSVFGGIT